MFIVQPIERCELIDCDTKNISYLKYCEIWVLAEN